MATVEPILSALVSRARTPRSAKPMAPSRPRSWRRMSSDRGRRAAAGGLFSQDQPTRVLGDVNGDGRADIVGFGFAGTYTALGQADGTFAAPILASNVFGPRAAGGGGGLVQPGSTHTPSRRCEWRWSSRHRRFWFRGHVHRARPSRWHLRG